MSLNDVLFVFLTQMHQGRGRLGEEDSDVDIEGYDDEEEDGKGVKGGLGGWSEREEGSGEDGGEAQEEREDESGSAAPSRCLAGMISSVNHNQLP